MSYVYFGLAVLIFCLALVARWYFFDFKEDK